MDIRYFRNFLSSYFVDKAGILQRKKRYRYTLYIFNDQPTRVNGGKITEETVPLEIRVEAHQERLSFDITKTSTYDATFRLSWLEKYELTIRFKEKTVEFENYDCIEERVKI